MLYLAPARPTARRRIPPTLPAWRRQPMSDTYDIVIRQGAIYDGSGDLLFVGDVAIQGETIVAVGPPGTARGRSEIDAAGLAVAPGFINMLSWAGDSLIADGR